MSFDPTDFSVFSDEELCGKSADGISGAEEELVRRYGRIVRMFARPLFLAGGDSEDLIQEGMFGLLTAIRSYNPEKEASFRTYAEICIRSKLATAVRAAQRDKHLPLNTAYLSKPLFLTEPANFCSPAKRAPRTSSSARKNCKSALTR